MTRPGSLIAALMSLCLALTAPALADDRLKVVATFSILGDLTGKIGGDAIDLTTLVGPDVDAHAFDPTAEAQRAVVGADILVANGLGFEPWLARLVEAAAFKGVLVEATKGIEPLASGEAAHEEHEGEAAEAEHDHEHGEADPHAFQDPKLVLTYIDNIAAALAAAAPAEAAVFQRNAEALKAQFRDLDADLMATLGALPAERKRILTSHDAFRYFGHAYGIDFVGVQGVSTDAEPSAQDLKLIVEQIRAGNIKAVFVENMNDPRFIETLAEDTGLTVGGDLFSDALSKPSGPAGDLLALFRHNQKELLEALQ
jgi:zinc/manganese transport system substrate-binding protein